MTKKTHTTTTYLIASLLLAGSAGCLASEDRRDDGSDLDFDNDKSLSARVWDSPEFAEYRRVSKNAARRWMPIALLQTDLFRFSS